MAELNVNLLGPREPAAAAMAPDAPAPAAPAAAQPPGAPPRPWWCKALGIRRREGKLLRFGLTKWGWLLALLVAGAVGTGGFVEYSMQPDFCRSCHIMEPYYQAWHQSTHSGVACVDCHFEPGFENTIKGKWQASSQAAKFVTGTYGSKPHAEVRDSSCLRSGCHEQRLLEGKVDWTIQTQQGRDLTIKFDHAPHLNERRRGKQLRCVSCHSQMVQGQHIVVTTDTCFLCHFKGLKHGREEEALGGCRACHDEPKGEIRMATGTFSHAEYIDQGVNCTNCHSDTIVGDGAVPKQLCWTCHNQSHQVARFGEKAFIHEAHITEHKVECSSCHIQIVHQLGAVEAVGPRVPAAPVMGEAHVLSDAGSCGQCHEQSHNAPRMMYTGKGGRGVPEMPSPMSRAQVDCIGCHQQPRESPAVAAVAGQTFRAGQSRCDHCHGNRYDSTLEEWKRATADLLASAEAAAAEARAALDDKKLSSEQALTLRRLLDDAEHNIRFVKHGHGVHNVTYATALLNVAIENSRKVTQTLREVALSQG